MPESIRQTIRVYFAVYLGLLLLLVVNVRLAFVPMGIGNLVWMLTIAFTKTLLIAIFFMHLRRDSAVIRIVATAGLLWLSLLFGLSLTDYLTRPPDAMADSGDLSGNHFASAHSIRDQIEGNSGEYQGAAAMSSITWGKGV